MWWLTLAQPYIYICIYTYLYINMCVYLHTCILPNVRWLCKMNFFFPHVSGRTTHSCVSLLYFLLSVLCCFAWPESVLVTHSFPKPLPTATAHPVPSCAAWIPSCFRQWALTGIAASHGKQALTQSIVHWELKIANHKPVQQKFVPSFWS